MPKMLEKAQVDQAMLEAGLDPDDIEARIGTAVITQLPDEDVSKFDLMALLALLKVIGPVILDLLQRCREPEKQIREVKSDRFGFFARRRAIMTVRNGLAGKSGISRARALTLAKGTIRACDAADDDFISDIVAAAG